MSIAGKVAIGVAVAAVAVGAVFLISRKGSAAKVPAYGGPPPPPPPPSGRAGMGDNAPGTDVSVGRVAADVFTAGGYEAWTHPTETVKGLAIIGSFL